MRFLRIAIIGLLALAPASSRAEGQPHIHVSFLQGDVQITGRDAAEWSTASLNMLLTEGDRVWVADDGKAELRLTGGFFIRMDERTSLDVLSLDRSSIQFSLGQGHTYVNNLQGGIKIVQLDTPLASVRSYDNSIMMLDVAEDGVTEVSVLKGYVYAETRSGATRITAGSILTIAGEGAASLSPLGPTDEWERWNLDRDKQMQAWGESSRYLPDELHNYSTDFDGYGRWVFAADYGWCWSPLVAVDWAPYTIGAWSWFGGNYVWVSYEPWGWAPYHYGRWVFVVGSGWCWVPPAPGAVHWGPGWVGWIVTGSVVAWVPLAPGEVFYGYGSFGPGSVNITNVNIETIVVNRDYRNLRARNSVTVIDRDDLGRRHWQRRQVEDRDNPFHQRRPDHAMAVPPVVSRPLQREERREQERRVEAPRPEQRPQEREELRGRAPEQGPAPQGERMRPVEQPRVQTMGPERRSPDIGPHERRLPPERVMRTNPDEIRSQRRIVRERDASAFRPERPAPMEIKRRNEPRQVDRRPPQQRQKKQDEGRRPPGQ